VVQSATAGPGGDDFYAVDAAAAIIEQSPRAFVLARPPVPGREVRRFNVKRFPYAIIYEVNGDDITVLAVTHHRRQPGGWHSRLPSSDPP
jgi:hypothetical protein